MAEPTHCALCHVLVAHGDPERKTRDGLVYHGSCYKKLPAKPPQQQPVQTVFAFMA